MWTTVSLDAPWFTPNGCGQKSLMSAAATAELRAIKRATARLFAPIMLAAEMFAAQMRD